MREGQHATTIREIEGLSSNADCVRWLAEDLKGAGVTPFIGAGLSMPFGFPGWPAFLRDCARIYGIGTAIQDLLSKGQYEEAAEACLGARNPQAFQDRLVANFGADKSEDIGLEGAVALVPLLAKGPVITTNFDRVLERVFVLSGVPFEDRVWGGKVSAAISGFQREARILLKLHGDVEDGEDRVLTRAEYAQAYGSLTESSLDLRKPLVRLLSLSALKKPFLFLGCSLQQDRTMAVLQKLFGQYPEVKHYALVEAAESDTELQKRATFLGEHGIQRPIWFPKGRHDLIEVILHEVLSRAGMDAAGAAARNRVPAGAGRAVALLAAVSRFPQAGLSPRADAASNSQVIAEALENAGICRFEVRRFLDAPGRDIEKDAVRLFQNSAPDDTLVFYYIGKSRVSENGELYLCGPDTEAESLDATALDLSWLRKQIDKARARRIVVILDCPFIGPTVGDVGNILPGQIARGHGKWVMTATARVAEDSNEGPIGFSKMVARAIRCLEGDLNGDGIVTVDELFRFLEQQIPGPDRPRSWAFEVVPSEIILARNKETTATSVPVATTDPGFITTVRPLMKAKQIIPFIGPGIYGSGPLSSFALSAALATRAELKTDEPTPLATAAQYLDHLRQDRTLLLQEFQEVLSKASQEPGRVGVHDLLCDLEPPILIVSATYDWMLEDRLLREGKPFVLVAHVLSSAGKEHDGEILVFRPGTETSVCYAAADAVPLDPKKERVIYKVMGSPSLSGFTDPGLQIDTTVLTEMDHLTFLGRLEYQHTKMPDVFNQCFQSRKLLFLGYSLDIWQYRLVMSLIKRMEVSKIYAVRQPKSAMETLCWDCLGARLIQADPESFIRSFRTNGLAAAARP
jgi:hypothetical protein